MRVLRWIVLTLGVGVFGLLFASADARFSRYVTEAATFWSEDLLARIRTIERAIAKGASPETYYEEYVVKKGAKSL